VLSLFAALVFSPWLLKNRLTWGSSMFPITPAGPPAAAAAAGAAGGVAPAAPPGVARLLARHRADWMAHGHGASLWGLPVDVTFGSHPDLLERYEGELGGLVLALAPLAAAASGAVAGPGPVRCIALVAVAGAVIWSQGARELRYLVVYLPLWSLLLAWLGGRAAAAAGARATAAFRTLIALGVVGGFLWLVGYTRPGAWLPYVIGAESRDTYLRSTAATAELYPLLRDAVGRLPARARVLFLWDERGYHCPRPFLPDHLVPDTSAWLLHDLPEEPGPALAALARLGVTHVLINRTAQRESLRSAAGRGAPRTPPEVPRRPPGAADTAFERLVPRLTLRARCGGVELFELPVI
jgi:hypothetical protein